MRVKITKIHPADGFAKGIILEGSPDLVPIVEMKGELAPLDETEVGFYAGWFRSDKPVEEFPNTGVFLYACQYEELKDNDRQG